MDSKEWKCRIAERSDMTSRLIHLTKESNEKTAVENLVKILKDKKINGSGKEGFIVGNDKAVCLQECPVYYLAQNIYYERKMNKDGRSKKIRYRGIGLMFDKTYIYKKGGRPVIYDKTEEAKKYLTEDKWWRIVNLDLSDSNNIIDWTHEREWRVLNELTFELKNVSIVVGSNKVLKKVIKLCDDEGIDIIDKIKGVTVLNDLFY
ncbi:DUF2971 domain-containing protein [Clostridium perfringens]